MWLPTHNSQIYELTEHLKLPPEGLHLQNVACSSAFALAVTLNFFSFPRQMEGSMEDVWHMDYRKISS